ncbi:glycosyltransferase [Dyadobacter arcticus]|uniref:Glycosyltransferase involved in cell wall biosynthesis n=1 Tax=Dyadobacter arcticus TaxID=1078754 RepID=A0ABX0UIG9_9BACT|nr:glycosyltransferase [Dyadobacter arcticus]NIJ51185.1 glycosyltransferase involved in cell wall biosynthesis [Dyadobacter arcticus]
MNNVKQRILFFTPFATRTGSEMMLLYILRRIDRSRFDVGIVSFANGELLKEFPSDIPVFIIPRKFSLAQKVMFHLSVNPILRSLRKLAREFKADLWYVNTTMLPETALVAKEFSIKLITHFHELPLTYIYLSSQDFKSIISNSHRLIGCSKVTCEAIQQAGGKNVSLLYEFIDSEKVIRNPERTAELRKKLNIPKDDYIWMMSGMTSERKGFDFLPDIAEELDDASVHLIWVGAAIDDGLVYYTEQRCLNTKAKTHIHLLGKQKEDYYNYLDMGNGFLLTSRQDPFPLVMIEAAHLGKPIVAFPSGGVLEFVEDGMGIVTEDLSVKQMVTAMRLIMTGKVATNAAKSAEVASRFSVENGYNEWVKLIDKDC